MKIIMLLVVIAAIAAGIVAVVGLGEHNVRLKALEAKEAERVCTCDFCGKTYPKAKCAPISLNWSWNYWWDEGGRAERCGIIGHGPAKYICDKCVLAIKAHLDLAEEAPND